MQDKFIYDYAVIRLVPKVDREEFINVGIIILCEEKKYLESKIHLDEKRLKVLAPEFDIQTAKAHLALIPRICEGDPDAGEMAKLSQRKRFNWLTSPRSTIIQTSPVHSGCCKNPEHAIDQLMNRMVISNID